MTMLVPRSNRNFFNSLMSDPFETFFDNAPLMRSTPNPCVPISRSMKADSN